MATIVHRCSPPSTLAFLSILILLTLPLASPIASTDLLPVTRTGGKYDCFSDNECSLGKFCNRSELEGLMEFGECIPLVKENAECISSYGGDWWIWTEETDGPYKFHNCQAGLYCDSKYKCRPTAGVGKSCDDEVYNSCEAGTYCDGKSKKCIKQVGLAAACGTSDLKNPQCLDSAGLYCKKPELSADTGICARKLTGGKTSDPHGDGCYGFEIEVGKDAKKVCMPRRLKGQFCRWNSQCDGERRPGSMRKDTVCNWVNKRTGYLPRYGVCAKERDLLRTAGAVCTPGMDLCDARRDLRCEKRGGKHVCVQKGGFNPHAASHCTPNSEFSECPGQECRRLSGMITTSPHGPFLCLRKIERLAQGEICSLFEHTHCKKGLKCVKAEGIRTKDGDQPLGYCMQQIGEGKNCTEWHRVACTEGTFCIADADAEMKCTKSTTKPRVVASFSGYQISCKSRDCAPGLVCVDDECQLPQKESKLRAVCGQTSPAFKVCANSTVCDDWGERREGRCEKHVPTDLEAGAECGESPDLKCGKGLTCSKLVSLFHMFRNICYDKTTSLKVGDKCDKDEAAVDDRVRNPNEGYPFPKCFIPAEDEKNPLKCLPKGKGLACQEEARLFEHCDAKEHIVCERGLVCSPAMSICLGADEIV